MEKLSHTLSASFIASFRDYGQRVHQLSDNLSQEQFWQNPYSYGNSFGHLVLHITGNLNFFIGTNVAGTGYVRNRALEFTDTTCTPKEETLAKLDEAIALVIKTLENQDSDSWSEPFEAVGFESIQDRLSVFLMAGAHFHHHIGQMIYLVEELSKTHSS